MRVWKEEKEAWGGRKKRRRVTGSSNAVGPTDTAATRAVSCLLWHAGEVGCLQRTTFPRGGALLPSVMQRGDAGLGVV